MIELLIQYDPSSGALQMRGPDQKPMALFMLEIAKKALLDPPPQNAVVPAPAGALRALPKAHES